MPEGFFLIFAATKSGEAAIVDKVAKPRSNEQKKKNSVTNSVFPEKKEKKNLWHKGDQKNDQLLKRKGH